MNLETKSRIAFDLDETLGTALTDGYSLTGFNIRKGCIDLLDSLKDEYDLVLWTVSNRIYLNKILSFGFPMYFVRTYSWDEIPCEWKDIRKINATFLVDDSIHHKEAAKQLESRYIIIPAYGSHEDVNDPLLWTKQIFTHIEEYKKLNQAVPVNFSFDGPFRHIKNGEKTWKHC